MKKYNNNVNGKDEKLMLINPIEEGTVIDHIAAGEALTVLKILGITGASNEVLSIATNVVSKNSVMKKDIVKISNRVLSEKELNKIALVSPNATINIIHNFEVVQKNGVKIPDCAEGFLKCPNPGCITNSNEPITTKFKVVNGKLKCDYCGNIITSNFMDYII